MPSFIETLRPELETGSIGVSVDKATGQTRQESFLTPTEVYEHVPRSHDATSIAKHMKPRRKYVPGQEVWSNIGDGTWHKGQIVKHGIQEIYPLYWVRLEGISKDLAVFEYQLSINGAD